MVADDYNVSLREHLEFRITTLEEKMRIQIDASERALELAKEIADQQREASNYGRDQLREQAATFIGREPFEMRSAGLDRRLDSLMDRCMALEKANANIEGRIWMLVAGLGLFFTALQIVIRLVK